MEALDTSQMLLKKKEKSERESLEVIDRCRRKPRHESAKQTDSINRPILNGDCNPFACLSIIAYADSNCSIADIHDNKVIKYYFLLKNIY